MTILEQAGGGSRWYDGEGNMVLLDPGMVRWEILVDDAGTPTDPRSTTGSSTSSGSFKGSAGCNDIQGRDFCTDVLLLTS